MCQLHLNPIFSAECHSAKYYFPVGNFAKCRSVKCHVFVVNFYRVIDRCYDTQHNDTQHNATQQNDTQH